MARRYKKNAKKNFSKSTQKEAPMRWTHRIIIILLALAFLPVLVHLVTQFSMLAINAATQELQHLFQPLFMAGGSRLEGVIKLCLYLIGITLLVRFLFGPRGRQ
jgi:hypothetical protein